MGICGALYLFIWYISAVSSSINLFPFSQDKHVSNFWCKITRVVAFAWLGSKEHILAQPDRSACMQDMPAQEFAHIAASQQQHAPALLLAMAAPTKLVWLLAKANKTKIIVIWLEIFTPSIHQQEFL